jgi:hypothetical protein
MSRWNNRVNELPAVLEKSVDRSGDALGHAGKTSEVFWRGRAAYGSVPRSSVQIR